MGRYRWLRLPFGLAVSSEVFQRLQAALDGLEGEQWVADDILVFGVVLYCILCIDPEKVRAIQ